MRSCTGSRAEAKMPVNLPMMLTWARIAMIPMVLGVFYLPDAWLSPHLKNVTACALFTLAAITDAEGFDVVFDATGYAKSMEAALAYVTHGGTLVYVSVVKEDIRFSDPEFHKREMMLVGSRNATAEDFRHVVASIEAGRVPVEALVTHRTTLASAPDDLARWATLKDGLIKAVVRVAA